MRVHDHVYRICDHEAWRASQAAGALAWSALDRRDGFVHLSTARQVAATLARYFAGRDDLYLLTIACDRLVEGSLRYEPAHGQLFPHFYGPIELDAIVRVNTLAVDERLGHRLPPALVEACAAEREGLDPPVEVRVAWHPRHRLALLEYPRPVRIEDEAGVYAWEAQLERRLAGIIAREGGRVPAVIGLDNLEIAAKVEGHYLELADKLTSRCFTRVARWASEARARAYFAAANSSRSLPSAVFERREEALAFALAPAAAPADLSILQE